MKQVVPILLLVIICITHLNILSVVTSVNARYNKELGKLDKKAPVEKDTESEKENKIKEKNEEQEKFYSRDYYFITHGFQLSDKDKFVCTNTKLNIHPTSDDVLQPPKAA